MVTGIKGEGVSTLAAALAGTNSQPNMLYERQMEARANLVVHDFPNFQHDTDWKAKARQLVKLVKNKHLLYSEESSKQTFVSSYLQ